MKRLALCILMAGVFTGCAAPTTNNVAKQEAKARWEQMRAKVKHQLAQRSFDNGRTDDALKACQEVLALDPANLDGYLLMARIQLEKGHMAEAEAALDEAAGLTQQVHELAYLRGMLAERREQKSDALDWYLIAYEAKRNDADYLLACAEAMLTMDHLDDAAELLAAREGDFEQDVRVQLLFGHTLSLKGLHREAGDAYLSAMRLMPNDPQLREETGLALLAAGRIEEAQTVLAPRLDSQTDRPSPAVVSALAGALLKANQAERAVPMLEPAAATHTESFGLHLLLAKAYLMLDKPLQALEPAQKACRLKSESVEARLLLTYAAIATGQRNLAVSVAQELIASNPLDPIVITLLDRALELDTVQ